MSDTKISQSTESSVAPGRSTKEMEEAFETELEAAQAGGDGEYEINDDFYVADGNEPIILDFQANDNVPEGTEAFIPVDQKTSLGTVSRDADGNYIYTPDIGAQGNDIVAYWTRTPSGLEGAVIRLEVNNPAIQSKPDVYAGSIRTTAEPPNSKHNFLVTAPDGTTQVISSNLSSTVPDSPEAVNLAVGQAADKLLASAPPPESYVDDEGLNHDFYREGREITDNGDGTYNVRLTYMHDIYRVYPDGPSDGGTGPAVERNYTLRYQGYSTASPDIQIANDGLSSLDVLGNDTELTGRDLVITEINGQSVEDGPVTLASGAQVSLNDDGTLNYMPSTTFTGDDTFTYTVAVPGTVNEDGSTATTGGESVEETVTIIGLAPSGLTQPLPVALSDEALLVANEDGAVETVLNVANNDQFEGDIEIIDAVIATDGTGQGIDIEITDNNKIRVTGHAGDSGTATIDYVIQDSTGATSRSTVAVSYLPGNTDPEIPFVPVRDYMFSADVTYTYRHWSADFSFRTDVTTTKTVDVTVTADDIEAAGGNVTFDQLVQMAVDRADDVATEQHLQLNPDDDILSVGQITIDRSSVDGYNEHQGQPSYLVGFGRTVTPPPGGTAASAFFIQGNNQIISGQDGDRLGTVSLEVYPDNQSVQYLTNDGEVDIQLTRAYAVGPNAQPTDLGEKFYIRATPGLNGRYEIGLEADQLLAIEDYEGQTIVLEIQATDKNTNAVYETRLYFNPTTQTVEGQVQTSLDLINAFNTNSDTQTTLPNVPASTIWPSISGSVDPSRFNTIAVTVINTREGAKTYNLPFNGPMSEDQIREAVEDAVLADIRGGGENAYIVGSIIYPNQVNATVSGDLNQLEVTVSHYIPSPSGGITWSRTYDASVELPLGTVTDDTTLDLTATMSTEGAGVTYFGEEGAFTPGNSVASFNAVDLSVSYQSEIITGQSNTSTIGASPAITGIQLDPAMSAEDTAFFNDHFEIRQVDGAFNIVQTAYFEPSAPIPLKLQLTLAGGGTLSTDYTLNQLAIQFPGREIDQILTNPDLVGGQGAVTGLFDTALYNADGVANVTIAGTPVTTQMMREVTTDLANILPDLLDDDEQLRAFGLSDDEIQKLRDTETLANLAAVAPGFVSLEEQDIPTTMELLQTSVDNVEDLNTYFSNARAAIVQQYFGGSADPEQVVVEMLNMASGTRYTAGAGFDASQETPDDTALRTNLSGVSEGEQNEFIRSWISIATLIDADTVGLFTEGLQNEPAFLAEQWTETLGPLVDAAAEYTDELTDRFYAYIADGELSEADIAAIIADEELTDEFLLSLRAQLEVSGYEGELLNLVATDQILSFAEQSWSIFNRIDYFQQNQDLTVKQAAAQGYLRAFAATGSFSELFKDPSLTNALPALIQVSDVMTQIYDIDSYRNEVASSYLVNRGDARKFATNMFFGLGRMAAIAADSAVNGDPNGREKFSFSVDLINSFGSTNRAFVRLAEYMSTGSAAEHLAINNRYYMLGDTSGGQMKLVAAEVKVTDADGNPVEPIRDQGAIDAYTADRTKFRNLQAVKLGDQIQYFHVLDETGNAAVDENGNVIRVSLDERRALADRVTNNVLINDETGLALYEKQAPTGSNATKWGEDIQRLNSGVTIRFNMTDDLALEILETGKGKLVEVDGQKLGYDLDSGAQRWDDVTGQQITIRQDLLDKAIAQHYFSEIRASEIGETVQVRIGDDTVNVEVTPSLKQDADKAYAASRGGEPVSFTHTGPASTRARLLREFIGADQISQGAGRIAAAWAPARFTDDIDLTRLQSISQRFTDTAAGATRITAGLARALANFGDIATIAVDVWTVVDAYKNRGSVDQGFAVANLIVGAIGTAAGFAALAGSAPVVAAAGPIGVAALAVGLTIALISSVYPRDLPEPTNAEVYGGLVEFLRGDNEYGTNVLGGAQVVVGDQFTNIAYNPDTNELHLPSNLTPEMNEQLAQVLGDAYDADGADWLRRMLGIYLLHLERQGDPQAA